VPDQHRTDVKACHRRSSPSALVRGFVAGGQT